MRENVPSYAVFDDFSYNVRIAVYVRWIVLGAWMFQFNYRPDFDNPTYIPNTLFALSLALINGYVHWRLVKGLPVTVGWALMLSALDFTTLSLEINASGGFANNFHVLYYPALAAFAVVISSWRISLAEVTLVALVYALISLTVGDGVDFAISEEKVLFIRIIAMYASVVIVNLIVRSELAKRRQAVDAERQRSEENVRLQDRAREAERALQTERIRISEEIHDGATQYVYGINLSLDGSLALVDEGSADLADKLRVTRSWASLALWELRSAIDGAPLFEGKGLGEVLESHIANFKTIAGLSTSFDQSGPERPMAVLAQHGLFRVVHNAMTNSLRHAEASNLVVRLAFDANDVTITISDDGVGLPSADVESFSGHGLRNVMQVAKDLQGSVSIEGPKGVGTTVICSIPVAAG